MKFYLDRFGANAGVFDSPEREHVLRALKWAQERGDHETVVKLARDRWEDVRRFGYKADAIELLRRRMASAAELEQPVSLYRAAFYLAEGLSNSGWTDEARSLLARCRRFFEWEGTRNNYLAPCVRVALSGRWDEPEVYSRVVEAALTAVRSRDEPPGKSTSHLVYVLEQVGLGQLSSALQQERLTLKPPSDREISDEIRLAWSSEDTANLDRYRLALEAARAKAVQEKLVSDLRENILPGLVNVAFRTGQTEGVDKLLAEWKQLIERSRDPAEWLNYYQHRAHLEVVQGRISEAVRDLSRAIEIDEASAIRGNPFDLETTRALRDAMAGDTKTARQRLEQLREQALRWSYGFNRLEWLAISAYTAARSGDDRIARENLAEYRRLYRDLGRGEKPGGNEALLRQLPAEIQTRAGQILASGAAPSRPTGFTFERDVPVSLPTRVRSRRDNRSCCSFATGSLRSMESVSPGSYLHSTSMLSLLPWRNTPVFSAALRAGPPEFSCPTATSTRSRSPRRKHSLSLQPRSYPRTLTSGEQQRPFRFRAD